MKINKNTKGFTLIELILVIVILGILGAVAVPKFSGIQESAKTKLTGSLIKLVETGLQNYAAEKLLDTGVWKYPATTTPDADFWKDVMDDIDEDDWTFNPETPGAGQATIVYVKDGTTNTWTYEVIAKGTGSGQNPNRESYTLTGPVTT